MKTASDSSDGGDGGFDKTHWTVILTVGDPQAPGYREACDQFCRTYWRPVYWYVLKKGRTREEAEDLTQEFFAWLLEERVLDAVTREGAKFRSYLVTVLKNFLANRLQKGPAKKRGGGAVHIPFDEITEAHCQKELADPETPESIFVRKWAQAVLDAVLHHLRAEFEAEGKQEHFECLKGRLSGSLKEVSYADASRILGMKIEAVREAAHRLRQRFKELLRREVATPGISAEAIDEEIRYLMAALARR